ncbi:Protein of unknown function, partial [Gryllus bimaculatus]
YYG